MAPPPRKRSKTSRKTEETIDASTIKPVSAEFSDHKSYRKSFKADKKYAKRHNALMFVERGPFDWTKLHFAVWRDELKSVMGFVEYHQKEKPEVLLQQGQWHETALQLALRMERSPRMIKELLRGEGKEAVDMNLEEYYFKDIDDEDLWYGMCYYPIHEAVNYKNHDDAYEVTKLLIENGADIELQDYYEMKPIESAVNMGHFRVVKLLMENGASMDETEIIKTALNRFDSEGAQLLQFMLSRNPDYIGKNEDVVVKCSMSGNIEALKVLIKAGAKVSQHAVDVAGTAANRSMTEKKKWPQKVEQIKKLLVKHIK